MTKPEDIVARTLDGWDVKYYPQFKIGPYRLDFFVPPDAVIEVDGFFHTTAKGKREDVRRDRWLREQLGWTVLRLPWTDIETGICGPTLEAFVDLARQRMTLHNEFQLRRRLRSLQADLDGQKMRLL